jgi:transcriptional regulator with GAF, ATPase, and Fis domain
MTDSKVWLHFFSKGDALLKSAVVKTLENAGISAYAFGPERFQGPGVLFFDEITQRLFDFLHEVSHNGIERVLAVAVSKSALAEGGAWRLLQAGASDVFAWDYSIDPAEGVLARLKRWNGIDQLVGSPLVQDNLIGQSPVWKSVLRQIVEVAYFTNASVLIMGESGTGKELVARLIHTLDQRPNKRELVVLDCTAIVPELSGSEFFGHERGSYTGAISHREGAFALANGGTLFLDEVGELSLGLQAQILRVVQERAYRRVGGNTWQHTDFRLVCATNKDLLQEVQRSKFRHDLYYRIASWIFKMPSLRERTEDILPLVHHFLNEFRPDEKTPELDEPVCEYILKREYPGNVRDLKQLIARISHLHVGPGPITAGDIPKEERPLGDIGPIQWQDKSFERSIRRALAVGIGLKEIGRAAEETAIRITVGEENGSLQHAARKLGVTDRALQMRRSARRRYEQEKDDD